MEPGIQPNSPPQQNRSIGRKPKVPDLSIGSEFCFTQPKHCSWRQGIGSGSYVNNKKDENQRKPTHMRPPRDCGKIAKVSRHRERN
jgi:hypothetical protein